MSASSKKKLRKEQAAAEMTEKQIAEQKEAKKLKMYTIGFAVIMVLVVCFALGTMAWQAVSNSGIIERNTKAVTIGEHDLTTAELSYYYVDEINSNYSEWYETYGDYTSMYMSFLYGLNLSEPLDGQYYDTEGKVTWGEYFANSAVETARGQYALYDAAVAAGHKLTEEEQANVEASLESAETYAIMLYGYNTLEDYLKGVYGSGATVETFKEYLEVSALASSYYNAHGETLSYDDSAISAYDSEHGTEYDSYSFLSFYIPDDDFLTGTTDAEGNTTYSDEDYANALIAAEKAANTIAGATITNLADMNAAIKALEVYAEDDTAVATESEDVLYTNIDAAIAEWLADSSRKEGEIAVIPYTSSTVEEHEHDENVDHEHTTVTTTEGYYIVMYKGKIDNTFALKNVRHILSQFEGGTTNETTGEVTYSDTEKQAALDAINKVKEEWEAGEATEQSFTTLVAGHSDDTASIDAGGLYENVYPGQMVEAFEEWCFDESRKAGDVEVIETEYGYHFMYFVGDSETTYRSYMLETAMYNEDMEAWYNDLLEPVTAENINISGLDLGLVIEPSTT